jgi:hydroxypyruvate isomerase
MTTDPTSRREWIKQTGGAAAGAVVGAAVGGSAFAGLPSAADAMVAPRSPARGPIKQSVSRWCYGRFSLPELCQRAAHIGLVGIDLLQQADWDVVRDAGLTCTMGYAADRRDFLSNGFTNRASHAMLIKELETALPIAKAKGVPNLIAMFGNRAGRSDAEAISAAVEGLQKVAPIAEATGVTVCVELLNSKVDHKDYHGDRTPFGVEVMKGVGSPKVKLLYDIYHMQIMEGDVIRTITQYKDYIGHYHTAGVPGRHELDNEQEINWPAVMQAIIKAGNNGYVAHEFIPTRDPWLSLADAYHICNVG